jgi:hypothetical protein
MQSPDTARASGRPPSVPGQVGGRSVLDGSRSTCRSQALVIDALDEPASSLRRRGAALKENADLRAEPDRLRGGRRAGARVTGGLEAGARSPCACRPRCVRPAPRGSSWRSVCAAGVLDSARLLVFELFSDSGRRDGRGRRGRPRRARAEDGSARCGGFRPRRRDRPAGLEPVAAGETASGRNCRACPVTAPAATDEPGRPGGARPSQTRINQRAGGGQTPATPAGGQP